MAHYAADELFEVFVKWINLFDFIDNPIKYIFELSDGVILFKLLNKLSPKYFELSVINKSPLNQYNKNNNIIELKQCLEQFFNDVIDQDIAIDKMIDHNKITYYNISSSLVTFYNDNISVQHYVRLTEMILLCSIKCQNKHITISKMTSLSMNDQAMLMNILQILMKNTGFNIPNDDENKNKNNMNRSEKTQKSQKPQTPKSPQYQSSSFRRLSIAKYSNQSHNNSLLSPFGSKTKKKKPITPIHFDYNMNLQKDLQKELESLRKENIKLRDEISSNQNEFKKQFTKTYKDKEKDLNLEIEANKQEIKKFKQEIRFKDDEINEFKKALIKLEGKNNKYLQQLQDIDDVNNRKLRELRDELDIAQHQNGLSFQFEQQIKQYKLRLESMNDIQNELNKYKSLYSSKCDDIEELNQKLKIIPNLKQQIEKYKKEMIKFKIASIGTEIKLDDKQITNKITCLEETVTKLNEENDELRSNLTMARKEIINLQTELVQIDNNDTNNTNNTLNEITNNKDLQSKVLKLESENKRLKSLINTKYTMNDLMDELDTKTRLLKNTELKYKETKIELNKVNKELNNMKTTTREFMRNSCSQQQYQNKLTELNDLKNNVIEKNKYIDQLRENKISLTTELNQIKQRYKYLCDYTEKQKLRLSQYKKAILEMQSFESNQKQESVKSDKYFHENQELKKQIKIISQEMNCVQNAFMNILKRQVLMNNNMLCT